MGDTLWNWSVRLSPLFNNLLLFHYKPLYLIHVMLVRWVVIYARWFEQTRMVEGMN